MIHKIYKISYLVTLLSAICIVTILILGFQSSLKEDEKNIINDLRVKVNPVYNLILNNWPLSNNIKTQLGEELNKDNIICTVTDLDGFVIYEYNSEFNLDNKIDLDEHLYFDQSYKMRNEGKYLLSLPINFQEQVVGFVIFEITLHNVNDQNIPHNFILSMVFLSILFVISIIVTIICYKILSSSRYESLIIGLDNVTKGIIKPLKLPYETREKTIYESYNRMVEELSYLMKKQQFSEDQRKSFLTKISHELKTPIATINAYIEGLVSGIAKDEETINNYHKIIQAKMNILMNQVEDLFKYAQDDMNQFKYNFVEIYADEVFDKILKPIEGNDIKRQIIIKNNIPKCIINVDTIRIEQVILNFFNNAIKHTKENDTLIIQAYRQEDEILISVEDNGEGIDSRDLPYIFDYYYQGRFSKKSDYEGVGLGLAICKEIISKHEGKIFVKSHLGKGTKISFTIPIV